MAEGYFCSLERESFIKIYKKKSDGTLERQEESGTDSMFMPGLQLNWGYSHRFESDMTLGFEATIISPAVRFGYMIQDKHHVAFGVHYALLTQMLIDTFVKQAEEGMTPAQKEVFSLKSDGLSGVGASISYEYFTESKNFFRAQLRAEYFSLEGKVGTIKSFPETVSFHLF